MVNMSLILNLYFCFRFSWLWCPVSRLSILTGASLSYIVTSAVDEKQLQEITSLLSKHPCLIIFMIKLQIWRATVDIMLFWPVLFACTLVLMFIFSFGAEKKLILHELYFRSDKHRKYSCLDNIRISWCEWIM